MKSQISFGNQLQFFISIDWPLSNTLAMIGNQVHINGDELHSSTKAITLAKKKGSGLIDRNFSKRNNNGHRFSLNQNFFL